MHALILQCGDVESNPGPTGSRTRQTTLSQSAPSPGRRETKTNSENVEPSLTDVIQMLTTMDSKMSSMDSKMDRLNSAMQEKLDELQKELSDVVKENQALRETVDKLEEKIDDLEGRSRRNNLIFHGLPQSQGRTESWADCEEAVKRVVKEEMGIEGEVEIERAHRLGTGQYPRPIIACFRSFKDKERILMGRRKLKDRKSQVFVNEDFSARVRDRRRCLQPFLRKAKAEGKRAYLRFDCLVVEGKTFQWDDKTKGPRERHVHR